MSDFKTNTDWYGDISNIITGFKHQETLVTQQIVSQLMLKVHHEGWMCVLRPNPRIHPRLQ